MSIITAKLLSDNLDNINELHNLGFSDETIASAARDKTGDESIAANEIAGFRKLGNIGSNRMLVSAKQVKKLEQLAKYADAASIRVIEDAKIISRTPESADTAM